MRGRRSTRLCSGEREKGTWHNEVETESIWRLAREERIGVFCLFLQRIACFFVKSEYTRKSNAGAYRFEIAEAFVFRSASAFVWAARVPRKCS